MSSKKTRLVMLAAVAVALVVACAGPPVNASGTVMEESRDVASFNRIEAAKGIVTQVVVQPDAVPSVTVRYDDNLLERVETSVSGQTLRVQLNATVSFLGDGEERRVEVVVGELVGLNVSGGSVVAAAGLEGDLTLDASGGSVVTLIGEGDTFRLDASGGSVVTAMSFTSRMIELDASGGSVVSLSASESVTGSASGGSVISVGGAAAINVDTSGGSRVN